MLISAFLLGENLKNWDVINFFLQGRPENKTLQSFIEKEFSQYSDIIQGEFPDNYQNLSYKNIMGKLWVSEYCKRVGKKIEIDE